MGYDWRTDSDATELAPDSVLLCGFPSAGLAATVAAHYMIRALDLPRIGVLHSESELPIAIVQNGRVNPPIRVHGRGKVGIVVSEFPPAPTALLDLAERLLDGAEARKVRLLLSLEGVVPHPTEPEEGGGVIPDEQSWVVTARPDAALLEEFKNASARPLKDAVLAGLTGALLVRGQARRTSVGALLVSARDGNGYPDHRAAASLIETVDKFLPELKIDTGPLRTQAELIERALRAAMKGRADRPPLAPGPDASIYQ